jgi:tetratricopeptide (TPR) repeat protein
MSLRARVLAVLTAAGLLAAAAALVRHGRGAEAQNPRESSSADLRYWYLDIYDDFFSRETGPDGLQRCVSRRPLARPSSFSVAKSTNAFRVFVIGGSVAAQYDADPWRIPGRTLADVLGRLLPGREVEVVHCGMGAYDSYRESLVLKEVLRHAPDLIVLMSGNNEFRVDAGPPPARLILALRVRRWLGRLARASRPARAGPAPPAPAPRPDVQASFAKSLRGMVLAAREAGAATVLCTLPRRMDNPPGGPLPSWLWQREYLQAWDSPGADAAAFWRRYAAQRPDEDTGHYFLARSLQRLGDDRGARKSYAAAKRCRQRGDTNPVVRETAALLGAPLADLEAAFDGLPQALRGGLIYRDPTHWYRHLDPLVSHSIARALVSLPSAAKGSVDAGRLAGAGTSLSAPPPDLEEVRQDLPKRLAWAVWESERESPRLSESVLTTFADLRAVDPSAFAGLPRSKEACREFVEANPWAQASAGEFERRWAFALAHAAETMRRAGDPRGALRLFAAAQAAAPEMLFWKVYKVLALLGLGRRQEAIRLLESLSGTPLKAPEVAHLRSLLRIDPDTPPVPPARAPLPPPPSSTLFILQKRAEALEAAGRLSQALTILRPALGQEPPDKTLLLTALRIATAAGDQALARDCLARLGRLRLEPRHLALVTDALRRLGRTEEALGLIDKALADAPRDAKLLNDKGVLESLLGRQRRARTALEAAIAADPDLDTSYLSLGAVLTSLGDAAGARRIYAAALARRRIWDDPARRRRIQEALR